MEVHTHTRTARNKWTHYFWEFFMLFLAVTAGFFVENQREHFIEHKREKEYISSLLIDLREDTASLKRSFKSRKRQINRIDSLILLFADRKPKDLNDIYYYSRFLGRLEEFYYFDRTISQLLNSGNLRLIRKRKVADGIMHYNNFRIKLVLNQQSIDEVDIKADIFSFHIGKIFDAQVWNKMTDSTAKILRPSGNPALITDDTKLINHFVFRIVTLRTTYQLTNNIIQSAITSAENLMALIQDEYHAK